MFKTEAILLTKDNAADIAKTLSDYDVVDLLAEADHLFKLNGAVVLGTSVDRDVRLVKYLVHESLYRVNNDNFDDLSDKTYTPVSPI